MNDRLLFPRPVDRARCGRTGLRQFSGTCWLNAALNGFLLSDAGAATLRAAFLALPAARQAELLAADLDRVCPRPGGDHATLRDHVLAIAARYLVGRRPGLAASANRDYADRVVRAQFPDRLGTGGFDDHATDAILDAVMGPGAWGWAWASGASSRIDPALHRAAMVYYDDDGAAEPVRDFLRRFPQYAFSHGSLHVEGLGPHLHSVAWYACGGSAYVYDSNHAQPWRVSKDPLSEPGRNPKLLAHVRKVYDAPGARLTPARFAVFLRRDGFAAADDGGYDRDAAYPPTLAGLSANHRLSAHLLAVAQARHERARVSALRQALSDPALSDGKKVLVGDVVRHLREDLGFDAARVRDRLAAAAMTAHMRHVAGTVTAALKRDRKRKRSPNAVQAPATKKPFEPPRDPRLPTPAPFEPPRDPPLPRRP